MKYKFSLMRFFMTSMYKKPKQLMVKLTLSIALLYGLLQLSLLNVFVFSTSSTAVYLFFNLTFSAALAYLLTTYLSIATVFNYWEFKMMAALPIKPEKIVYAKIMSSLLTLLILTGVFEIPTLILLATQSKWLEMMKVILFIPSIVMFISVFLLFVLAVFSRFKSKISAFAFNVGASCISIGVAVAFLVAVFMNTFLNIKSLFASIDFSSVTAIAESITDLLNMGYEAISEVPFLAKMVTLFTTHGNTTSFLLIVGLLLISSFLLMHIATGMMAANYVINGSQEIKPLTIKKSKTSQSNNIWITYLQREAWVLQTEAYFKMQVFIGLLLTPIVSILFMMAKQKGYLPPIFSTGNNFEFYFGYMILFLSCMNNMSGTPYSREGKYRDLLKSLPFDQQKIYFSKVMLNTGISLLAGIISYLLYMGFGFFTVTAVYMMLIVMLLIICYNVLSPLYDSKHPITDWHNPAAAVKSNPNIVVSLLYGLPILIVIFLIHYGLRWLNASALLAYGIPLLASFLCTIIVLLGVVKKKTPVKLINKAS